MDVSGIKFALQVRDYTLIIAFIVVVLGAILLIYRGMFQGNTKILQSIALIAVVVALIMGYPTLVLSSSDYISESTSKVSEKIEKGIDDWGKTKILGQDSTFDFAAKFTKVLFKASMAFSSVIRSFLIFIQRILLYVLIAMSPVILAFLLINETSSIAVKFLMTSLGVIFWGIGFNLSDIMLFTGWDLIIKSAINNPGQAAALGSGAAASAALAAASISTALPVITIGIAFMVAFYFLVGIIVFNAMGVIMIMQIFHGGAPLSSMMQSITAGSMISSGALNAGKMANSIGSKAGGMAGGIGAKAGIGKLSNMAKGLIDSKK